MNTLNFFLSILYKNKLYIFFKSQIFELFFYILKKNE